MQLRYTIDLFFANHAEQTIAYYIIKAAHLQPSMKTCKISEVILNPIIVMI